MDSRISEENESDKRTARNRDIIRRMRNGDPLTSFDSRSSWFPPRPILEKDKDAMARLYKVEGKELEKKLKEDGANSEAQLKTKAKLTLVP